MQRLILFRHASAEARAPSGDDFDRALAADGRTDAALMAEVLKEAGLSPDLALVSAARRTQETWAQMAPTFPGARLVVAAELYNASADEIRAELDGVEAETVIVVAHNPGLHELAIELTEDAAASHSDINRVAARFPTATAAAFRFDAAGRPCGDGLFHAKDYGGVGA